MSETALARGLIVYCSLRHPFTIRLVAQLADDILLELPLRSRTHVDQRQLVATLLIGVARERV